jgi:hypothetical protein
MTATFRVNSPRKSLSTKPRKPPGRDPKSFIWQILSHRFNFVYRGRLKYKGKRLRFNGPAWRVPRTKKIKPNRYEEDQVQVLSRELSRPCFHVNFHGLRVASAFLLQFRRINRTLGRWDLITATA